MPFSQKKLDFLARLNKQLHDNADREVLEIILDDAATAGQFRLAQRCLLNLPYDPARYARAFDTWQAAVRPAERDLLLTRFLLVSAKQQARDGTCRRRPPLF